MQSVRVKKNGGDFADITSTYQQGYVVTENGTYTFVLTTESGDTASTSITYTKIDGLKPVVAIDAGTYTEGVWSAGSVTLAPYNTVNNLGETVFSYRIGEDGS